MKNYGPYVVVRPRSDGRVRFRFEVPARQRPDGWPATRPINVDGKEAVFLDGLSADQEAWIHNRACELYRDLSRARIQPMTAVSAPAVDRSWEALIILRDRSLAWTELEPSTQKQYRYAQRIILRCFRYGGEYAPSVILESQVESVLRSEVKTKRARRAVVSELRALLDKAVVENWRPAHLKIRTRTKLPTPHIRVWTPEDVQVMVTAALQENERGIAKMILTQWEVGQRLVSVRLFRYGHHYRDGYFFYRCRKTRREVRIEVVDPNVRRFLDADFEHGGSCS